MAGGTLWERLPLAGRSLIEASAGTGKTYTIAGLYARLVAEAGHRADRILVVTFTRAATAELRDRIRRRLVRRREAAGEGEEVARHRLTNAIRGFDEAAVFTIHGFCQRALAESAFETGLPFETELLPDTGSLVREVAEDFWRIRLHGASPLFARYVLERGPTPEDLGRELAGYSARPGLALVGPEPPAGMDAAEAAYAGAFAQAREAWAAGRAEIEAILREGPALKRNIYKPDSIPGKLAAMDAFLGQERPAPAPPGELEAFTSDKIGAATKKGELPPEHPLFEACQALRDAAGPLAEGHARRAIRLRMDLRDYGVAELRRRKRALRVQAYDDLLADLAEALDGPGGGELAAAVRRRYTAVLVDEFQDTDPLQYRIFRRLFGGGEGPLVLVGDPKQAIYGFRNADVFAYLAARRDAGETEPLLTNYRSDEGLIDAVNGLFAAARRPFLLDGIEFVAAHAAPPDPQRPRKPLRLPGGRSPPLELWWLGEREDGKPWAKQQASEIAAGATAAEIARLLNLAAAGDARIGDRPLAGGDVAVLVRTHRQGAQVRQALQRLGLPSVTRDDESVFQSREAVELARVLRAVASPRDPEVRAALVTELMGAGAGELYREAAEEGRWEARLQPFHECHRLWQQHGFMAMFRHWYRSHGLAIHLLGLPEGERRLTNLLHLAELIQDHASQGGAGMEGVLRWLAEQREAGASGDEARRLRLESDEQLVQIVTVHAAKGLEYPLVFLPFMWDGRRGDKDKARFHDPAADWRPTLDLGSEGLQAHLEYQRLEQAAEDARLLYVALTRAVNRCCLVWGNINLAERSPLAWLLHQGDAGELPAAEALCRGLDAAAMRAELESLIARVPAIRLRPMPEAPGEPYGGAAGAAPELAARPFERSLEPGWRVSSFSAIAAGLHQAEADHDEAAYAAAGPAPEAEGIFAFPAGPRAGVCLHEVFERLDFAAAGRAAVEEGARAALRRHGFEESWTPVVADCVARVLDSPLEPDGGLRLRGVGPERRLAEMEFHYPIAGLDPTRLQRLLEEHGAAGLVGRLSAGAGRGYLKGYVDLVFEAGGRYHLADYKSNHLGPRPEDYGEEALAQVMAAEGYHLQYLLYAVALHRYLGERVAGYDYETHFGGVYYLFLRGMDPASSPRLGVYRQRPAAALMQALSAHLDGG